MTSRPTESAVPPGPAAAGPAPVPGHGGGQAFPGDHAPYPGPVPGREAGYPPPPAGRAEARSAMLAYLGVPVTLVLLPLLVYLTSLGGRPFARWHAAQALNAAVTALLYALCGLIAGGMLALDSAQVATFIMLPLLVLLWAAVLITMIRAAGAAGQGRPYQLPRWLRVR
jgi:uncharacterized Tic20 family protein